VAGYVKGRSPADACVPDKPPAPPSHRQASASPASDGKGTPAPSLLELWLGVLANVAQAGRALALALHSLDVTATLKEITRSFSSHPRIMQAAELVYGALAFNCQVTC